MGTTRFVRLLGLSLVLVGVSSAGAQTTGSAALVQHLNQLAGQYASDGTPVGSPRSGELGESQEKRIGLHLDAGKCYVFIAVAEDALQDLDLALESEGSRLGEDTQPDNYPVVRACSPVAARVEIVLTATRGVGAYLLGQYEVPVQGEALQAAQAAPPAEGLQGALEQLAAQRTPGATLEGDLYRGRLIEDEVAAISRPLRAEICYTFVAVAGEGARDLNLSVMVGSQKVGEDNAAGVEAVVPEFCPAQAVTATIRVTMVRGAGDMMFGTWSHEATGQLTEIVTVDTAMLTRRLTERAATAATGMNPIQSPQFGSLREGRSANLTFAVEAGKCYRAVGVTEPGITNLDLTLFIDNQQVAEDIEPGSTPVVGTCTAAAGAARIDVWAVQGAGGYALAVYDGNQPATASTGAAAENPLFTLLDSTANTLSAGSTRASQPFTGRLAIAGTQQYDISLQAGKCYALVGISDAGNLDLEISSGAQVLGRDTDLDTTPGVLLCPQAATTVRAKLTLLSAAGNFAFGVYNAPSVGASTTQPRPTATGIAVGGTETDYLANQLRAQHEQVAAALLPVSQVNRGTLQQAQESEFIVNLPAGRCYTIIGAGVPSVRDMDVTLTSPYGQVLATDSTDDATPVLVTNPCPQWSGDYRIKVYMQYGYGAFGFQVFSQ